MKKYLSYSIGLLGIMFLFVCSSSSQPESLKSNDIHTSNLSPKKTYHKYLNTNDILELKEIVTGKKLEQFGKFEMTSEQLSMLRKLSFRDQTIIEENIENDKAKQHTDKTEYDLRGNDQRLCQ